MKKKCRKQKNKKMFSLKIGLWVDAKMGPDPLFVNHWSTVAVLHWGASESRSIMLGALDFPIQDRQCSLLSDAMSDSKNIQINVGQGF